MVGNVRSLRHTSSDSSKPSFLLKSALFSAVLACGNIVQYAAVVFYFGMNDNSPMTPPATTSNAGLTW